MRHDLPDGLVQSTLKSLGVPVIEHRGDELIALCPGHKMVIGRSDNTPSWSINERTGVHFCFSCGFKGNLFSLVRDLDGKAQADALLTQYREYGRMLPSPDDEQPVRVQITRPSAFTPRKSTAIGESDLLMFDEPPSWALSRRRIRSTRIIKDYEIRWDRRNEAWILPLRYADDHGLMGYQVKSEKTRMFRNRPRSIPKADTLFGLPAVTDQSQIVVVESPLDAVLLADMEYPSVAVCGSKMSAEQINLLRDFDRVFIWFDNDTAGRKETDRLRRDLPKHGIRHSFVPSITDWKDPGDMPYGAIDQALSDAGF